MASIINFNPKNKQSIMQKHRMTKNDRWVMALYYILKTEKPSNRSPRHTVRYIHRLDAKVKSNITLWPRPERVVYYNRQAYSRCLLFAFVYSMMYSWEPKYITRKNKMSEVNYSLWSKQCYKIMWNVLT